MFAPTPCRSSGLPFPHRCCGKTAVIAVLLAALALPAATASAADVPDASARHAHHHPHHARAGHHPVHPKTPLQEPAPVVPVPPPPPGPPPVAANIGTKSGLPLPRFASLRAEDVNMRSGPGSQYPILWLYRRRDLPVEIEREFDLWRLVVDSDGVKGWVHQATLSGSRSFIVTATGIVGAGAEGSEHGIGTLLRDDPRDDGGIVAILRPGVVGRLRACPASSDWCRVSTPSYSGWLLRSSIFGLLPNEAITHP